MTTAVKCVICDQRPQQENGYCHHCNSKLQSDRKAKTADKPFRFLTYRGHVVGLFRTDNGTFRGRLLRRKAEGLPKGKTINLNVWCDGYTREKIKAFKKCVLQLANA